MRKRQLQKIKCQRVKESGFEDVEVTCYQMVAEGVFDGERKGICNIFNWLDK